MANSDEPFDPHSAPTIMEQVPAAAREAIAAAARAARRKELPPPKKIGDILKEGFELYQKNLLLFLITAAVAMGPVYLVKDVLVAGATSRFTSGATSGLEAKGAELQALQEQLARRTQEGASAEEIAGLTTRMTELSMESLKAVGGAAAGVGLTILVLLLTIPLILVANFLAQAALVVAISDRARDGHLGWQGAWAVVFRNLGGVLVTSLLTAAMVAVGLVMCILPGLVAGFLAALAMPVVLLERKAGVDAIKRSFELVKGDWLRVLLVLVVFAVLNWVASFVGGLFVPDRFVFLNLLVGDLVTIVVAPIPIIGLVLVYNDIVLHKGASEGEIESRQQALLGPAEG